MKKLLLIGLVAMQLFGDCSVHLKSAADAKLLADESNKKSAVDMVNAYHIIQNRHLITYQNCKNDKFRTEMKVLMKNIDAKLLNISTKAGTGDSSKTDTTSSVDAFGSGY